MLNCNSEETQRPQLQPVDVVSERREFDEIPQDVLIFLIWEVLWQMMPIDSEPNLLGGSVNRGMGDVSTPDFPSS